MDIPRHDAADEALYYEPYTNKDFPKTAQESQLPQNVQEWPALIIQAFASQHPYAYTGSAPEIEFEKVDERSGCAFGALVLRKPYQVTGYGSPRERLEQEPERVAVPVIVENFKLKPFEIFIRGEQVLPLTQTRFAETQQGSGIANGLDPYFQPSPLFVDKMIPPTVGYLGNLYGNYSLSGGEGDYSSWVPAKGAQEIFEPKLEKQGGSADTSKEQSFLGTIRNTIRKGEWDDFRGYSGDERAMASFALNKTLQVVREILGTKPTTFDDYMDFIERSAPVHLVCLKKLSNGRWRATSTNDYFYKPVVKDMKPAEVVAAFSEVEPGIANLLNSSDTVLIESPNRSHVRPVILEDHPLVAELAGDDGHYIAITKDGSFVEGLLVNRVLDYSGNSVAAKLFFAGNAHALQEQMVGERIGDVPPELKEGSLEVGAEGTFLGSDEVGQFVMVPFKVTNVGRVMDYAVSQAIGPAGEKLTFVMMPGVTRFVNATGIADPMLGDKIAGNIYYVPPSFKFIELGKKLRLVEDPREANDLIKRKVFFSERSMEPFSVESSKRGHGRSVRVITGADGAFTLKGAILEGMGYDCQAQDLPTLECHWALSVLGVPLQECARITAMALDRGEVNVSNLRPVKDLVKKDQVMDRNLGELAAAFRRNLFKQASTVNDPKAVDAMLSLNFVNEANLIQFLQNIPMFREVEGKLAELYLYSALGLKNQVPEQAALSAMKSVNEVVEHLEYLQSMLQAQRGAQAPAPAAA